MAVSQQLVAVAELTVDNAPLSAVDMDAFQPIISRVPWLPVIGNHEYYDGHSLCECQFSALVCLLLIAGSRLAPPMRSSLRGGLLRQLSQTSNCRPLREPDRLRGGPPRLGGGPACQARWVRWALDRNHASWALEAVGDTVISTENDSSA